MPYPTSANRFFLEFAELEFAMVEKGVAIIDGDDFLVKPHWADLFNRLNQGTADTSQFIQEHRAIVITNPPQQLQYIRPANRFEWRLPNDEAISDEDFDGLTAKRQFDRITICLRRVRNNLFHGSKIRDPSEWTNNRLDQCFPIILDLRGLVDGTNFGAPSRQ